ncbi:MULTISPECIES: DUF6461 domain-containing protein [Streptomyces]|uniref:DUF6461 domain-containing protein n=1 Tax=Streptomyces lonegramiae TaxID=3075524 RepID=A0ABU2XCD1_9ACTN|nr:DUF6461 domain-containing protein [Streptomyces sp. DSM 41529]MDT0543575.1 DUF6461 domain-containing protein [Streptomyces sp. DSM 41529]
MADGIRWLADGDALTGWMTGVVFAREIDAEELAVRMGGAPGAGTEPITGAEVVELDMEIYRPDGRGDGVVRVGEHAGWAFAIEYGDSTGGQRLEEISREGAEAIHYVPVGEHPPATFFYARDGRSMCGFGLCEEAIRWGEEPDLLLPDLVAAGILRPDGKTHCAPEEDEEEDEDEDYAALRGRTLAVVEKRFGLSLPPVFLTEARLPAYAVRGTPDMTTEDPDFDAVCAWATVNGYPLPSGRLRLIPGLLRRAYQHAISH